MTIDLEPGDEFTAPVVFKLGGGLATVGYDGHDINIGYVTCEKGTRVALQYLGQMEQKKVDVHYAICLSEDVVADNNEEWVRGKMDSLIKDEPPEVGKVSYAEVDEVDDRGLGITYLGGEPVQLGPVRAETGTLVRIVGAPKNCAEVRTMSARGDNYMTRFNILSEQFHELPVAKGDDITTTISDFDDETPIGYVGEVPVRFPDAEVKMAQKIDGEIIGFERDMVIGEVTETYDEVGRIENAGHWARMQWLSEVGFGEEPLRAFAEEFIGVPGAALPERDDLLRDALIAEAIRLGLRDKTRDAEGDYPETHISGLRHWVIHKLAAILGDPSETSDDSDEPDWFSGVMSERKGPTITFYGDVLRLAEGYYAPAPSRAVMTTDTEAVLVSGEPSRVFVDAGLDLEFRGISRVVTNTSEAELAATGIPTQPVEAYVGLSEEEIYTESDLATYIDTNQLEEWHPEPEWQPYTGHRYGFQTDGDPRIATMEGDRQVSLWRVPVEYGTDAYQLKIEHVSESTPRTLSIQRQYQKQVSLIIDSTSGFPQQVELSGNEDTVVLSCDFIPPRPQMRWLHAVGGNWIESSRYKLQWAIPPETVDSVTDIFGVLPVSITNNAINA